MIHNYDKWRLLESFGNGEETFTQELDKYGKLHNVDFSNFPEKIWGELEGAVGKIIYSAELDMNSSGIEDIYFGIVSITLEIETRVYKKPAPGVKFGISDDDDEGELVTKEFHVTKDMIGTDVKADKGKLPFYLTNLEIDFGQLSNCAIDKDGNIDYKKVKFELTMGE